MMSSSFTNGTTTVTPVLVDGYTATRNSQHVYKQIVGGGLDVYTYPASKRTGTLTIRFRDRASAQQLHDMLSGTTPVTFADTDLPSIGMKFLLGDGGRNTIGLDDETRSTWVVTVDFQEIA